MEHIPFQIGEVTGYLNRIDKSEPPTLFHVMVGKFYHGQLLFQRGKWVIYDSPMSVHAEALGKIVEAWYE